MSASEGVGQVLKRLSAGPSRRDDERELGADHRTLARCWGTFFFFITLEPRVE